MVIMRGDIRVDGYLINCMIVNFLMAFVVLLCSIISDFTITTEILTLLVNKQAGALIYNMSVNLLQKNNLTLVFFYGSVLLLTMGIKVVCGFTRLSPGGSTANCNIMTK